MYVRHLDDCPAFIAGDETILRELLHPARADVALGYSLAHAVVPVGARSLRHRLKTSEVYFLLSGKGLMHIDEDTAPVRAGETIYIPPGALQWIENTGTEALAFLCIVDPAWRPDDEDVLE